ncbi:unnamed protein product [Clavelina lepadiformis]|uniref:BTB domain-containing protein n=1 Tax=Clavelina lepadiformis TaxID=159417 RepID=A0ABP0GLA9_CLALP
MKMSGMSQVLTHRNPSHASESFSRFNKLRREGLLCDLTILVQGQKFKAHKVVMAACSDYFLTAICGGKSTASVSVSNGASGSHMTIELQYVTLRGFAPLLEYAYTSDLNVNASRECMFRIYAFESAVDPESIQAGQSSASSWRQAVDVEWTTQ